MVTQTEFGRRLREQRERKGLSQTELSDAVGLSKSYISLIEAGQRQASRKVTEKLAARLGVDVEYLLVGLDRPTRQERELQLRFAELALYNGDAQNARTTLEGLRSTAAADDPDLFLIDHRLAQACERLGALRDAIGMLEGLRERAEEDPARHPLLQVVIDLSRCYREIGDLHRAVDVAQAALTRARELGLHDSKDLPRLTATLAAAAYSRGDLAYAAQLLQTLLERMDETATRRDRASALWNASVIAADQGNYAEGILLAQRALTQFAEEEDVRAEGLLRTTMAWMMLDSGMDVGLALELLESAHQRLDAAGMTIETAYAETELSRAHLALGNVRQATEFARCSLARLGDSGQLEGARARLALARALLAGGERAAAVLELEAAAEALEALGAQRQAAAAWRELADLFAGIHEFPRAQVAYQQALELVGIGSPQPSRAAQVIGTTEPAVGQPAASGRAAQ